MTRTERSVLRAAVSYGVAVERVMKVYDAEESVRGLDQWHPKHTAWERRLFRAETARDRARDALRRAAYRLSGGKRKELR